MLTFYVKTFAFLHVWNKMLQAKWPYWPWDHFIVFMKSHFDIVFASQIRIFHGRPTSSVLCIIDVYLFVQHICIYVFYIYIYICTWIWILIWNLFSLISLDFIWFHLLDFTRCHLISIDFIWFHFISLDLIWFHLVSLDFICFILFQLDLINLCITWFRLISLYLISLDHISQGKRERSPGIKRKGKTGGWPLRCIST